MTTKELARHVMAERGLNTADTALLQLFTRRTGALHPRQKVPKTTDRDGAVKRSQSRLEKNATRSAGQCQES
jgi:hypothetical protein